MKSTASLNLAELQRSLDIRRQELKRDISMVQAEIDSGNGQEPEEPEDFAQRQESQEVRRGEIARDRRELAAIDHAMARIEAGDYGVCVDCGQPIAMQRLLARPESIYCLSCKERLEERD